MRLQCPLVEHGLKSFRTSVLGFGSATDFNKRSLSKEAIILNGTNIFIYLGMKVL